MGRQIKQKKQKRISKYYKECQRCGNDGINRKEEFKCRYCGYFNETSGRITVTRGGLDD